MAVTADVVNESLRQKTLEVARGHKASWIELGQCLHTVYKDKLYRNWNYLSFEVYCGKELGIKQTTASKLLKSYYFLEKEEPRIVSSQFAEEESPAKVPNYESVNLLRLAKENKDISSRDFAELRESVLEKGKEPKEVRTQVKKLLSEQMEEKDPAVVRNQRRSAAIKRVVTFLSGAKREFESDNLLPGHIIKQMNDLMLKLEDQLEG